MSRMWQCSVGNFVLILGGLVVLTSGGPVLAQEPGDDDSPEDASAELELLLQQNTDSVAAARAGEEAARTKQQLAEQEAQAAAGAKVVSDNAKLLKSGITVGISAGLHFPIGSTKGTSLQNAAFVAMPYVVFLPGYWWKATEARREYCASEWGGGGESDAAAAAMEIARRKASNKFETFVSAIQANATDAQILEWESSKNQQAMAEYKKAEDAFRTAAKDFRASDEKFAQTLNALRAMVTAKDVKSHDMDAAISGFEKARQDFAVSQETYNKAVEVYLMSRPTDTMAAIVAQTRVWIESPLESQQREARKNDIIRWLSEQDWNSSLRGKCGGLKWGAFLGMPLKHEVRVRVRGVVGMETRDFVSHLSFGITFTPNAYVSVLVGVAVGDVERQGPEGTPRDGRTAWAGTVSLGGNFDLAAALIKGAQSIP